MFYEGDLVGQYQIVEPIGSGGMATVYLATHASLNRQVAIKVMHDTFQQDNNFQARFEREAQIVAQLEHPHIIPVYDYSSHDGKRYLVMKYVPGKSLRDLLDKSPLLTVAEILHILTPIADALTYAHKHGIVHRDIKPSNIVIDEDDTPYLADFGLARLAIAGESTMSQDMILGTPHYVSPEQAQGIKDLDGRADIYSLGVVLYQLLVGHVPFSANTPFAVIHDHIYTPPPTPSAINPDIPDSVEEVLNKALEKKPDDRFSTANEFIDALRTASQQAKFEEINADIVSAAAESIAVYRTQIDQQLTTQKQYVTSPLEDTVLDSKSLVTEYRFPLARWWLIGGCIALILSLGMTFATFGSIQDQAEIIEYSLFESTLRSRRDNIWNVIPTYSLREAEQAIDDSPTNALPFLGAAHTFWENNQPDQALSVIDKGLQQTTNFNHLFLILAGDIALDASDTINATQLYLRAYENAINTPQEMVIQNTVAQTLYDMALESDLFTNDDIEAYQQQLTDNTNPLVLLTLARYTITLGQDETTQQLLNRVQALMEKHSPFQAHYHLIAGDYLAATGSASDAQREWESALNTDVVPQWIQDQVNLNLNT